MKIENVLVTGGAGFIGSNFIIHALDRHPDWKIVNLDILTYAGNLENLKGVEANPNYQFIHGDIGDQVEVRAIMSGFQIDTVIHFAAESHVDRSIEGPEQFVVTNVLGTQRLLDACMAAWKQEDGSFGDVRFLQVGTDEVYGSLGKDGFFTEETPLAPNSPYSASKTAADLLVRAYFHTYGFPGMITRCSNNYGPYHFPEKLIPLMIYRARSDGSLPVYGDGKNVRDWLYVEDHCSALDTVVRKGTPGEVYNIGGNNEWMNIDIVKLILKKLEKPESLIEYVKDRPGHDRRYAIDAAKIKDELGWEPSVTFEEGIEKTIQWYLDNQEWVDHVTSGDYQKYYKKMYNDRG